MKKVLQSLVLLLGVLMLPAATHAQDIYGDVNGDHEVNIADVNFVISIIIDGTGYNAAADVNGDLEVTVADINTLIDIILTESIPVPDFVDLGLPSGTLWATRNVGACKPEDYGEYFAWGETEIKYNEDCNLDSYKWYKSDSIDHGFTKYCVQSRYGYNVKRPNCASSPFVNSSIACK